MLAVAASADAVRPHLRGQVVVGGVNAPKQTIVAGPRHTLDEVARSLRADGVTVAAVPSQTPFHSPALDGSVPAAREAFARITRRPPAVPVVSCYTGAPLSDAEAMDPDYWAPAAGPAGAVLAGAGDAARLGRPRAGGDRARSGADPAGPPPPCRARRAQQGRTARTGPAGRGGRDAAGRPGRPGGGGGERGRRLNPRRPASTRPHPPYGLAVPPPAPAARRDMFPLRRLIMRARTRAGIVAVAAALGLSTVWSVSAAGEDGRPDEQGPQDRYRPGRDAPARLPAGLPGGARPRSRRRAPSETSVVVGTIKPVLGGAWYQWDALRLPNEQMPNKALSRWMIGGWNATDKTFTALYNDDRGTYGVEHTEPGAATDGHARFTGQYTIAGKKFTFIDEFTKIRTTTSVT